MTVALRRLLASKAPAAVWIIRLLVGAVFVSEGIQKFLFPAELGVGRFTKIGLPSPEVLAPFVGVVEIVGLGVEVVELGEDALEDALEGGLPRVGVVGLLSVRVGAGCSIVVVGDAVMVRDRDTVGAVMESSPPHEATSTAARPMTAARETSVSATPGTCRCLVVIVALLVAVLPATARRSGTAAPARHVGTPPAAGIDGP